MSLPLNLSVDHDKPLISNLYNEFGNFREMLNRCTVTKPIRFLSSNLTVDLVD